MIEEIPSLGYETHIGPQAEDGSPLLLLLHGRGSHEGDLQGLAPLLPQDIVLVTPRAPFPAAPWGYGPGWAWYRYLEEDRVVTTTLETSLAALDALLERLDRELPIRTGPRVLGGFSQGGTTSLAWALSRPGRLAGVVNLSGFLVNAPELIGAFDGLNSPPVFWGHGEADPAIPYALARKGRRQLAEAGVTLHPADHPGGHTITSGELAELRGWLEGVVQSSA